MKRLLALLLAATLCLGVLAGCGNSSTGETTVLTETTQPPVEDDGILKILMIGHSLGNDSVYLLPETFKNEGMENVVIGSLYHSGCRLAQHAQYSAEEALEYAYFEYDMSKDTCWQRADCNGKFTDYQPGMPNDKYVEDGTIAQTVKFGVQRHDWDIIVTQAGVFEAANVQDNKFQVDLPNTLKTLVDYVLANDIEPRTVPQIGWNMTWTCPSNDMLNDSYKNNLYKNFENQQQMYEKIADTLKNVVEPSYEFDYIMPSGTAIQNLESSYLECKDIYRDYIHATDFSRMVVSYVWYCKLTGNSIDTCKFGGYQAISSCDEVTQLVGQEFTMTEDQKALLIEAVTNALANPYNVTQSQYTTAP